ncbi:MAG: hypothetical protein ABJC12_11715, partial [Saprospiraceae bacterium]
SIQYMSNKIGLLFVIAFYFSCVDISNGQTVKNGSNNSASVGISAQLYPAGLIATLNSDIFLASHSSVFLRAGGNFTNRKDFSKYNDNEKGAGFGGSIGLRKHYFMKKGQIIAGLNTDLWNMWINWKNDIGTPLQTQGKTYTLVVQPWLETGYFTGRENAPLKFGITGGFGREINVITKGKVVGHGWIGSVSIYSAILFKSQS